MPEISRFYGIVITMFINDHNPPHFHVRYEQYRALIEIKTGRLYGHLPSRAVALITEWMNCHKDELFENWELLKNGEQFKKIKPLE